MKRITSILLVALILVSCVKGEMRKDEIPTGTDSVLVEFSLPKIYGGLTRLSDVPATKSDRLDDLRSLGNISVRNLEEGSLLWMSYFKKREDNAWDGPFFQGYVLKSLDGIFTLMPCGLNHTHEGYPDDIISINSSEQKPPLYLKPGIYKFKMLYPAVPLYYTNLGVKVNNGDTFYATDGRYVETYSREVTIAASDEVASGNKYNVQFVPLPGMVSQMAQFKFKIKKGPGVYSLDMMEEGIEITGIQTPYGHYFSADGQSFQYFWSSENIGDTLVMRKADKSARIYLKRDRFVRNEDESLDAEITFLPTDALSTDVIFLFNMLVNGIPTQFTATLSQMIFAHAHSFNMEFEIKLNDGIYVLEWMNQSWSKEIIL